MIIILYTSYLSKLSKLPPDINKLIITRFPPKWLNVKDYPNTYLVKFLSPSQETLLKYKRDNNWNNYVTAFKKQIENDINMKNSLETLLRYLEQGKDYILVCYEKDYLHCHRYLIAQWMVDRGIEWREI